MLIASIIILHKSYKTKKQTIALLNSMEKSRVLKITARLWREYCTELEKIEKFELCEIIRNHVDGLDDNHLVAPPKGFQLERNPNNPFSYYATHPAIY
jgi:isocitrate/isopropylmalate dehydrogenase